MKEVIQINDGEKHIEFVMDIDMQNPCDSAVMHYVRQGMPCEPEVVHVMTQVVREGDTVLDGGANVGFFTLLLSRLVGPSGRVIAVEPGINNSPKLKANIDLNGMTNVEIVAAPLWGQNGKVPLFHYDDGGANSLWANTDTDLSYSIDTVLIDQLCERGSVKLIKLDIEGAEYQALLGGRFTLRQHFPFVVVEMNAEALKRAGSSSAEVRSFMATLGYIPFVMPIGGGLPAQVPMRSRLSPQRQNSNILFSSLARIGDIWPEVSF